MKKNLLLAFAILLSSSIFAQIGIIDTEGENVEETVIDVYLDIDVDHIETDFFAQNNSAVTKTYNMKRWELEYIEGSDEYYCWTLCLGPKPAGTDFLWVFPGEHITLEPDSVSSYGSPAFHFRPWENEGEATYRYVIYDVMNPSDSTWIDMHYIVGAVGVNEYSNTAISNAFPNPANDVISITMNEEIENARFEIYSMVGSKVRAEQISNQNGVVKMDVSDLVPGIYMLQEVQSQLTRKFIISR